MSCVYRGKAAEGVKHCLQGIVCVSVSVCARERVRDRRSVLQICSFSLLKI